MTTTGATAVTPTLFLSPPPPQILMSPLELDGYLTGVIVTPRAAPIRPGAWMARLWRDEQPAFENEEQINTIIGAVAIHYNTLLRDIDRSLKQMEVDRVVDYRPLFVSGEQKPEHDAVRTWIRGFWKAMELAPDTWTALVQDERTKVILQPFASFFDLGELAPDDVPANTLDEDATLIPRMILVLRKIAHIRETTSHPAPLSRRTKIGRNDPCPCGSGKKYKRCCGSA